MTVARSVLLPTVAVALSAALVACGGSGDKKKDAAASGDPSPCDKVEVRLRKQLGPEMQAVTTRLPLVKPAVGEIPATPLGCAVGYTLVPEELAEEGVGDEAGIGGADQRLAFVAKDAKGRWDLTLIDPSSQSPGPVSLEIEARDVTEDGVPEVVVREASMGADAYQGLRIFSLTAAEAGPRDLLTESLKLTTGENLQLFAGWKTGTAEGKRAVIFEAGGNYKIFTWSEGEKRFALDDTATTAANPKPPPPPATEAPSAAPAPATDAPAAPAPEESKGKKGKKGKGDKKAKGEEKPAAPLGPIELP